MTQSANSATSRVDSPLKNQKTGFLYPDFDKTRKPENSDFDIKIQNCSCMDEDCDATLLSASVEIGGKVWSVKANTHTPHVLVHKDFIQKGKCIVSEEDKVEEAFWKEIEKLGYSKTITGYS